MKWFLTYIIRNKKIICRGVAVAVVLFLFQGCVAMNKGVDVNFTGETGSVVKFAKSELLHFLDGRTGASGAAAGINRIEVSFCRDSAMPESSFAYKTFMDSKNHNILHLLLRGHNDSDLLLAVYTFLEDGGYIFNIDGPVLPAEFDWNKVKENSKKIIPSIKKRGIRQHINFPMDLSAWSLEDAKKYIRNLARMRFNAITFHSYPNQWYEFSDAGKTEYAGHFFYGYTYTVPDYEPIKKIAVNRKYFCIPEIEQYFEDEPKRSKMAINWLREVIKEAKRAGMEVTFSFEPRDEKADTSRSVEIVKSILQEYPMIDALEIMTEEIGGWGKKKTVAETRRIIKELFGEEYLNDKVLNAPMKNGRASNLGIVYAQLGHNIKLLKYLQKHGTAGDKKLGLGIYVVIPKYTAPAFYIARKMLPNTEIAMLSGHHSRDVARNIPVSVHSQDDWQHLKLYSWIEFDGLMYLQQNASHGISESVSQMIKGSKDHRGNAMLFNHWRTAENKVTAKYASESTLDASLKPAEFHRKYAERYGISNVEGFAEAMLDLDKADQAAFQKMRNGGFCWEGRWRNGRALYSYPQKTVKAVGECYKKVISDFAKVAKSPVTDDAQALISLLNNRVRTTVVYLRSFEKGYALKPYMRKKKLTDQEKKEFAEICNEGIAVLKQYIDIYAEKNVDRGCAGNLVSLWDGPLKAFKKLRKDKCGIPYDDNTPTEKPIDAPPLPIRNE